MKLIGPDTPLTPRVIMGGNGGNGATVGAAQADPGRTGGAGAIRAATEDRTASRPSFAHRVAMRRRARESRGGEAVADSRSHGMQVARSVCREASRRPVR